MNLKYGLEDKPPLPELLLFGIQWFLLLLPSIIILGQVVAGLHDSGALQQVQYLQKMIFISSIALFIQLYLGHRLPLVIGPSTVLLVGMIASGSSGIEAIYTSIMTGGILLAIIAWTGFFAHIQRLFTPRVVAVVMLLIGITLTPTITGLLLPTDRTASPLPNLAFALAALILIFAAHRFLSGIWKSTLVLWVLVLGSMVYRLLFPAGAVYTFADSHLLSTRFLSGIHPHLAFEPGVLLAFIFCFLALAINDLGSIESVGEIMKPDRMDARVTRGVAVTGLANLLSGLAGVIGPVNYSMSPGVIASTGCAARITLLPAGIILFLISFMPPVIGLFASIPRVLIGLVLTYVMSSQVAAGFMVMMEEETDFDRGLVVALPILLSVVISFLPSSSVNALPVVLRPIVGNGFVVGVLAVLFLEHVLYRDKSKTRESGENSE
jgi:xanthine/uracil permease